VSASVRERHLRLTPEGPSGRPVPETGLRHAGRGGIGVVGQSCPGVRRCVIRRPRPVGAPGWGRRDPDVGSGVGSPAQALELAPKTLAGPALAPDSHDPRSDFPHGRRRAAVHVARCGDGSSNTRLDRPHDLHTTLAIRDPRLHPIACANPRRRLGRRSIDTDVTALAQSRRKRAGLHEAHRAQPAIDACLRRGTRISHAF
jgi:hypothetical protein